MRILIIDDSKAIYSMVSAMLNEAGHSTVWAEDGQKAVDTIKGQATDFDVILLDWNMPVMNGPEFLELNIKENFTKAPIVMMTTENSPEAIKKALSLNAAEYIMKPFTSDILINKLTLLEMMF